MSEYYPDEIARVLCKLAYEKTDCESNGTLKECEECLYWLKAAADNPYNNDYFRALYNTLELIADKHEGDE